MLKMRWWLDSHPYNGLHDDQVCASVVLLSNAAVVAAAILHPRVNSMVGILQRAFSGCSKMKWEMYEPEER